MEFIDIRTRYRKYRLKNFKYTSVIINWELRIKSLKIIKIYLYLEIITIENKRKWKSKSIKIDDRWFKLITWY